MTLFDVFFFLVIWNFFLPFTLAIIEFLCMSLIFYRLVHFLISIVFMGFVPSSMPFTCISPFLKSSSLFLFLFVYLFVCNCLLSLCDYCYSCYCVTFLLLLLLLLSGRWNGRWFLLHGPLDTAPHRSPLIIPLLTSHNIGKHDQFQARDMFTFTLLSCVVTPRTRYPEEWADSSLSSTVFQQCLLLLSIIIIIIISSSSSCSSSVMIAKHLTSPRPSGYKRPTPISWGISLADTVLRNSSSTKFRAKVIYRQTS